MSFGGFIQANTQVVVIVGPFVDVTDGFTPETGITLGAADEAELLKHGSTSVVGIAAATWAAVTGCDGYYALTLTTSHTDTEGLLTIVVQDDSVCLPVKMTWQVIAQAAFASFITAKDTGYMDVNVKAVSEDTAAADNLEAACDNYSATRGLAGTALPPAAADAAGGLPISDAGGLDVDAKLANTNEVTAARMGALTDLIDGGRLDLLIDAILLDTGTTLDGKIDTIDGIVDTIVARIIGTLAAGTHTAQTGDTYARLGAPAGASVSADIAAIEAQTDDIGAAGAGLTAVPWNAAWDAEVQSEAQDAITASALATAAELAKVPKSDSTVSWNATALAAINAEVDTALNTAIPGSPTADSVNERVATMDVKIAANVRTTAVITGVVATDAGNSATTFKVTITGANANDFWKYAGLRFTSGALAGQIRRITAYTHASTTITCDAFTATPADAAAFELVN